MHICSAQTDTLIGKWGEAIPAKVKSFTKNGLRVERQMQTVDDKLMNVKYTDVDALRFADGFKVRFQDGALVRDNLLSAPSFRRSFMDVRAEGLLTLTQDEVRQYYGLKNYEIVYKPFRDLFHTGFLKMGGGLVGFAVSTGLSKARLATWSDSRYCDGLIMRKATAIPYGRRPRISSWGRWSMALWTAPCRRSGTANCSMIPTKPPYLRSPAPRACSGAVLPCPLPESVR